MTNQVPPMAIRRAEARPRNPNNLFRPSRMNYASEVLLLCASQLAFSFSRTLNVRYTAANKILPGILSSAVVKATWLVSSALGIASVLDGDLLMCAAYVVSGGIGDYLSFKVRA